VAVRELDEDAALADGEPAGRALAFEVIDDDRDAVAERALVRLAPAAELVSRRPDSAIALALGPLDLKAALAALRPADRVVVDGRVQAEVVRLDELAGPGAGGPDRLEGRAHDLGTHIDSGAHTGLLGQLVSQVRDMRAQATPSYSHHGGWAQVRLTSLLAM